MAEQDSHLQHVHSRCHLSLVLLGVAPPCSAPLGVLRPKPLRDKAQSPIRFFLYKGLFFLYIAERKPYRCALCISGCFHLFSFLALFCVVLVR
jgi:hypothetical protein